MFDNPFEVQLRPVQRDKSQRTQANSKVYSTKKLHKKTALWVCNWLSLFVFYLHLTRNNFSVRSVFKNTKLHQPILFCFYTRTILYLSHFKRFVSLLHSSYVFVEGFSVPPKSSAHFKTHSNYFQSTFVLHFHCTVSSQLFFISFYVLFTQHNLFSNKI